MTCQSSSTPESGVGCNQEALALKEAGNKLFRESRVQEAVETYQAALKSALAASDHLPALLMQNTAAAALQNDEPISAFIHAGAVLALPQHESYLKSHYRAAKAAEIMGLSDVGLWPLSNLPSCDSDSLQANKDRAAITGLSTKLRGCHRTPEERYILEMTSEHAVFVCSMLECAIKVDGEDMRALTRKPQQASASSDAAQQHALSLKQQGNDAFARKEYVSAMSKWREALAHFPEIPMICSNLAAAFLKQGMAHHAGHAATAVLAFQPMNVKALTRAASAALQAGWSTMARQFAERGRMLAPSSAELRKLNREARAHENVVGGVYEDEPSKSGSTSAGKTPKGPARAGGEDSEARSFSSMRAGSMPETQRHEFETRGHETPEQLERLRAAYKNLEKEQPSMVRRMESAVGLMPEEFQKTFLAEGNLPPGCSHEAASKLLAGGREAFHYVRLTTTRLAFGNTMHGMHAVSAHAFGAWTTHLYKVGRGNDVGGGGGAQQDDPLAAAHGDPCLAVQDGQIFKRLGTMEPERWKWFRESPIGDIRFRPGWPYPNCSGYLASFSNVAQHPLPLQVADTSNSESQVQPHIHVDVGFADLGVLCETLAEQYRLQSVSAQHGVSSTEAAAGLGASRWEHSAHRLNLHWVWYSAGWTPSALADFHSSVSALLLRKEALSNLTTAVEQWIRAWHGDKVPLKKARAAWIARRKASNRGISNCLCKNDRIAACYYAVSGDVVPLSGPYEGVSENSNVEMVNTGSVLMFGARPDSARDANYAIDEDFLFTVPPKALVRERLKGGNFYSAGARLMKRRVQALAAALNANMLHIEVRHATVSAANMAEMQYIKSLNPDSMRWSNICDYCTPRAFHTTARMCSTSTTQHFFHSMNWALDTKGTHQGSEAQELKRQRYRRFEIRQQAEAAVKVTIQSLGADKLMRVPPLDNSMNICDALLGQQLLPKWLQAFALEASGSGVGGAADCRVLHDQEYWMYTRSCGVAHCLLKYPQL